MGTRKTREEMDAEMERLSENPEDGAQESPAAVSDLSDASNQPPAAADIAPAETMPQATPSDSSSAQAADPTKTKKLKSVIESLLFSAGDPVPLGSLIEIAREIQPDLSSYGLKEVIESLRLELRDQGRGIRVVEVGGGFQLRTPSETAPYVRMLVSRRPPRMTRPTLETLAIVAYRQPVTRGDIEDIRGVDSGAVLRHLLERRLVKIIGRKEEAGKPLLYATTREFLSLFSLKDLKSLPTLKDFVELSDEHRATLGLAPAQVAPAGDRSETTPAGEDLLRADETSAYSPVGDDEFVQELAEALDELRKRDRKLRETVFPGASPSSAPAPVDTPQAMEAPAVAEETETEPDLQKEEGG